MRDRRPALYTLSSLGAAARGQGEGRALMLGARRARQLGPHQHSTRLAQHAWLAGKRVRPASRPHLAKKRLELTSFSGVQ
jgi:hypothetical protein